MAWDSRPIVGEFPKKISCTAKTAEGTESQGEKNRASAFYHLGPIFEVTKIPVHVFARQNQSCKT